MQLQCQLAHMAGQTLVVDGSEYYIDLDGLCSNLSAAHGERLLGQLGAWAKVGQVSEAERGQSASHPLRPTCTVAPLELPEGTELMLPERLHSVAPVRKKRGRPRKGAAVGGTP